MKRTQQLTADNLLAWKRTEAELRREFQTQEAALQKTLGKLRTELARVSDEARENREKSYKLQSSLNASESNVKVSLNLEQLIQTHLHHDSAITGQCQNTLKFHLIKSTIGHFLMSFLRTAHKMCPL